MFTKDFVVYVKGMCGEMQQSDGTVLPLAGEAALWCIMSWMQDGDEQTGTLWREKAACDSLRRYCPMFLQP